MKTSHKILVISCNETINTEIDRMLTEAGYEVQSVDYNSEIDSEINSYKPDLLILFECSKFKIDIWTFIKEIYKGLDQAKPRLFILLENPHNYSYINELEKKDLYDYALVLPVDVAEILTRVNKLLI